MKKVCSNCGKPVVYLCDEHCLDCKQLIIAGTLKFIASNQCFAKSYERRGNSEK
jgi:hypothetical protein